MIKKRTVFILGAGASSPYGFPIGKDLNREILTYPWVDIFKNFQENKIWNHIFNKYGEEEVKSFIETLRKNKNTPIDVFCEYRSDYIEIAKALISLTLIKYEIENNLYLEKSEEDWCQYLFNEMKDHNMQNNNVSFITYNYDRSFEYYFINKIKTVLNKDDNYIRNFFKVNPVLHLHGILGELPLISDVDSRNYNDFNDPTNLDLCISKIKTIHEDNDHDQVFKFARELLYNAEIICFLGFGYDQKNIERLTAPGLLAGKTIYGTTYGFTASQIQRIKSNLGGGSNIKIDENGKFKARKYLEERTYNLFPIS